MANNFAFVLVALCFAILIAGCGSQSSTDNDMAEVSDKAEYDLSLYLFNQNLRTANGQASYVLTYYNKAAPESGAIQISSIQLVRNGNSIDESARGLEGLSARYTINDLTITEESPTTDNARSILRFAAIGGTYINNFYPNIQFQETCTLENHLDSFDLSIATDGVTLASGVYEDVVQVYCDSSFLDGDIIKPNFNWKKYYAKGIGLIFVDGDWPNLLGPVYAIAEY